LAYAKLERETDKDNCAFEARRLTATAMTNLMGASPSRVKDFHDDDDFSNEKEIEELVGPAAHVKTALLCLDMHLPSVARNALDLGVFDPDDLNANLRDDERLVYKLCLARAAVLEAREERETDKHKGASSFATEEDDDDAFQGGSGAFVANEFTPSETDEANGRASSKSDVAFGVLMDALSIDATDPKPFELLGDVHKLESRYSEAEEAYTHAMACSGQRGKPPASLKLFLNLGDALLRNGKTADARGAYAAACEMRPCASTWIGLGKSLIGEGDLEGAEAALAEANVLDASNPDAWTQLAILSLLAEPTREDEAERAIGAAFKRGADDPDALARVAALFLRVGGWKHAEAAARRAVKHGAGVETRLCLARASRERGDAEGAAAELKYALALAADEGSVERTARRDGRGGGDDDDDEGEGGGGAVGVPFLVPELLEELAGVYDELGDARRAEECRRDLRALEREQ
jgi:tetratricopeptide (TPR) repeat protein